VTPGPLQKGCKEVGGSAMQTKSAVGTTESIKYDYSLTVLLQLQVAESNIAIVEAVQ